jgi:hypothetical protein
MCQYYDFSVDELKYHFDNYQNSNYFDHQFYVKDLNSL